ncbi:6-carboxy-5,6,7,8-tetrahydropterin synthase @ Folate biosynthesis protein PTPS-III, catalyzes a reaction that bypasses dihydroneopterin aldolase (FolB) [hydrothermal vent metagenome]|uniref:6-carboxy-5,6,7,8-tetrahydropterin synthase @ Folate biosynthesis protein PTPS-III, catalyzes a reaction that bypasses dihydroneopterin aldolase (FolB) n=1 Tax=hydrothermal vent metagenome TaxID=652676 RepID=A0A3B1DTN8_9ZZZZ
MPQYRVRVTKDHLVFSAAHFITFNGNICERLHGHNWRVAAEVAGPLDENYYVFDFIALRDGLQKIVNQLDHRMLLATKHPAIKVTEQENEVEVRFEERRWVFPKEDCILLPIENTTAERIAHWIALQLQSEMLSEVKNSLSSLTIEVEENFGQWAICEMSMTD